MEVKNVGFKRNCGAATEYNKIIWIYLQSWLWKSAAVSITLSWRFECEPFRSDEGLTREKSAQKHFYGGPPSILTQVKTKSSRKMERQTDR